VQAHWFINDGYNQITLKGCGSMNTLGHLEKMLMLGEITEDEYKERKAVYVQTILEMYVKGILTKEQMEEKLNQ
jgi:hypothetical protein